MYRNEAEVGVVIGELGLERSDLYITTKYSGLNGLDIPTSIRNSLNYVRYDHYFMRGKCLFDADRS
jgi:diketogulonate reductase-like aldo/keto reductase